jgi:hypothetical protein
MVEPAPSSSFEVAEPNLLLELPIVVLDTPAQLGVINQSMRTDVLRLSCPERRPNGYRPGRHTPSFCAPPAHARSSAAARGRRPPRRERRQPPDPVSWNGKLPAVRVRFMMCLLVSWPCAAANSGGGRGACGGGMAPPSFPQAEMETATSIAPSMRRMRGRPMRIAGACSNPVPSPTTRSPGRRRRGTLGGALRDRP